MCSILKTAKSFECDNEFAKFLEDSEAAKKTLPKSHGNQKLSSFLISLFLLMAACSDKGEESTIDAIPAKRLQSTEQDGAWRGTPPDEKKVRITFSDEPQITADERKDPVAVTDYAKKMGGYIRGLRHSKWPMDASYPIERLFAIFKGVSSCGLTYLNRQHLQI